MRDKTQTPMVHTLAATEVIHLNTIEPPLQYDYPELGAVERVDPKEAVVRVLSAFQTTRGNATHAARLFGITYVGLRRAIKRLVKPTNKRGNAKMFLVDMGDGNPPVPLKDALALLQKGPSRTAKEATIRAALSVAVGQNIRLIDIAQQARIEGSRLTKFRARTGTLQMVELAALEHAINVLQSKPITAKSGRRAAA